jgi:hypothetical protein
MRRAVGVAVFFGMLGVTALKPAEDDESERTPERKLAAG